MELTARFGLPLLVAGQGQKEITHNEALMLLDAMVGSVVEQRDLATPPVLKTEGQCWLVPAGATGEWSGRMDQVAIWTAGGWRYVSPPDGASVYVRAGSERLRRLNGLWMRDAPTNVPAAAVDNPTGGLIIDSEARAVLASLLERLRLMGLIET
jgi:hypothetical protein